MKIVNVVAAVIVHEGRILATQRGYGDFKDGWEFPGGKIEAGESHQEALVREIKEELAVEIEVGGHIRKIDYDYDTFHLSMDCYWCEIKDGKPSLLEHEAAKWLKPDEIYDVDWLPADRAIIPEIQHELEIIIYATNDH